MFKSIRFWLFVRNLGGALVWLGAAVIMGGVLGLFATKIPNSVSTSEVVGYMCLLAIPFAFGMDKLVDVIQHHFKEKKMREDHKDHHIPA